MLLGVIGSMFVYTLPELFRVSLIELSVVDPFLFGDKVSDSLSRLFPLDVVSVKKTLSLSDKLFNLFGHPRSVVGISDGRNG